MAIADEMYPVALEAVKDLPARVLLTVGNRIDITELGPIPANIHVEPGSSRRRVPEASLVICHGGSGTTFGALAAGLPLVIVPLFADQFANGTGWPRQAQAVVESRQAGREARGAGQSGIATRRVSPRR